MAAMARASSRLLAVVLTAGLSACQTGAQVAALAPADKLDATLSAVARNGVATPALWYFEPGMADPFVETILRFDGNLAAIRAQGARVRSVLGNIATVDIPASRLEAVAALPGVVSIEAARRQALRRDRGASPAIGAPAPALPPTGASPPAPVPP
ncbi:MAG: hypothetical protein ABI593_01565 [Betaproteobacteria bacterium]